MTLETVVESIPIQLPADRAQPPKGPHPFPSTSSALMKYFTSPDLSHVTANTKPGCRLPADRLLRGTNPEGCSSYSPTPHSFFFFTTRQRRQPIPQVASSDAFQILHTRDVNSISIGPSCTAEVAPFLARMLRSLRVCIRTRGCVGDIWGYSLWLLGAFDTQCDIEPVRLLCLHLQYYIRRSNYRPSYVDGAIMC